MGISTVLYITLTALAQLSLGVLVVSVDWMPPSKRLVLTSEQSPRTALPLKSALSLLCEGSQQIEREEREMLGVQ
jgi:hypothetical protein